MLPLSYALRNLYRDPARLLQTILGSALVVLMIMGAAAINQGMRETLDASGAADNVILLGAGSEESVLRSEVNERAAGIAQAAMPGIVEVAGRRAISPEIQQLTYVSVGNAKNRRALVRGVTPDALLVHTRVSLVEGRFPRPGEVMAGRLSWRKLGIPRQALRVGEPVQVEGVPMILSGLFAAPSTVMESEWWMDLNDLRTQAKRNNLSSVILRMRDDGFADADLFTKQRLDLELSALRESDYYARLADFYAPLRSMTWLTALLIAAGAFLGGLNTLYAAFASRIREIATLQTIGFRPWALALSLVEESMLACLCGAILAAFAAMLWLDGLAVSFSIGTFILRLTPEVAFMGLGTGMALGLIGAIPPALRCLLPPLPTALRAAS
ncbi:MAG: ABC transporter permease [Spartobacteria bacterium]|nr:ABC transporter permease [Spartobacteria bacterium]